MSTFLSLMVWPIGRWLTPSPEINYDQFQVEPGRYRVQTVSLQRRSIVTSGGIRIEPDLALDRLAPHDSALLILPGGMAWAAGQNTEAVDVARRFLDAGVPVAAICGATLGLARCGLLDHLRHTSNTRDYLAATQYRGVSLYEEAPAVTDGNLITAPGTAPIDFAYHIFQRLNLYRVPVLDAWYGLYKTGKPEYFDALMQAANA